MRTLRNFPGSTQLHLHVMFVEKWTSATEPHTTLHQQSGPPRHGCAHTRTGVESGWGKCSGSLGNFVHSSVVVRTEQHNPESGRQTFNQQKTWTTSDGQPFNAVPLVGAAHNPGTGQQRFSSRPSATAHFPPPPSVRPRFERATSIKHRGRSLHILMHTCKCLPSRRLFPPRTVVTQAATTARPRRWAMRGTVTAKRQEPSTSVWRRTFRNTKT